MKYLWRKNELKIIEDNETRTDNKIQVESFNKPSIFAKIKRYIKKVIRKIKKRQKKMIKILLKISALWPLITAGFSIIKKLFKRRIVMSDEKEKNIQEIGDEIISNFSAIKKEAGEVFAEIKEKDWAGVIKEVPDILQEIQKIGKIKNLSNEDKKAVAVYILNKLINIPVLPEFVEAKIISALIETVLAALKSKFEK